MHMFRSKQPWPEYPLEFDFTPAFQGGESTISIYEIIVKDIEDNTDVTEDLYAPDKTVVVGMRVYVWCKGGEDGHQYKYTVRVEGAIYGERHELDGLLPVQEI